jgi:hypothetical protein
MNNFKKAVGLLGLVLSAVSARAATVDILAVYEPGVSTACVAAQMGAISIVLANTDDLNGLLTAAVR